VTKDSNNNADELASSLEAVEITSKAETETEMKKDEPDTMAKGMLRTLGLRPDLTCRYQIQ